MQMNGQSPRPACFEHVADEQWNDWRWQLKNRWGRPEDLEGLVALDAETREEIRAASEQFLMGITPYYASLMQEGDLTDPIYLQAVPCSNANHLAAPPCSRFGLDPQARAL